MTSRYLWAWFTLAALVAVALLWTHRREYAACDTDGCVAINRWTGTVVFQPASDLPTYAPEGSVVRRSTTDRGVPIPARNVERRVSSPGRALWR